MRVDVLDQKQEGRNKCFLARATLQNYLDALPPDFDRYHIQRDRTTNVYLDKLVDTVLDRGHIPTIVLIAEHVGSNQARGLQILDGLQRTLRLRDISRSIAVAQNVQYEAKKSEVLLRNAAALRRHSLDASIFLRVIEEVHLRGWNEVAETMRATQWFEIWTGLNEEEQVEKMLLLNAGHKPVKTRHQLELLFLGVLPKLEAHAARGFVVVREKEQSSTRFAKERQLGEFHFASIIASLVAFFLGKPVTTNAELISDLQNDDSETSLRRIVEGFSYKFSSNLAAFLVELDELVSGKEPELGIQWVGREVVLVGMFAALGDYSRDMKLAPEKVFNKLLQRLGRVTLNLRGFERVRNQQDLGRVNVGAVNKRAVFSATRELLDTSTIARLDWTEYFGVK